MINIKKLRCGECASKGLELKDLAGWFSYPYKRFPNVLVTETVEMPVCPKCKNVIITADRSHNLEIALEHSIEGLGKNHLTDA